MGHWRNGNWIEVPHYAKSDYTLHTHWQPIAPPEPEKSECEMAYELQPKAAKAARVKPRRKLNHRLIASSKTFCPDVSLT